MKKITFLLFIISTTVFSQESNQSQKTNEIYLSGGTILAAFQYALNYSRGLVINNKVINGNLNFVAGFGELFVLTTSGFQYKLSLHYLSGLKTNHFEIGSGIYRFDRRNNDGDGVRPFYAPQLNLGYKYLKPNGKLSFRTGLGYPELLYVSFGRAF